MKIKFANLEDAKSIKSILDEHLIDIKNPQNYAQKSGGFLIRDFSEKQIQELVLDDKNNLLLVVKKDDLKEGKIIGYLSSSRLAVISEDMKNTVLPYLKKGGIADLEKVLYHRQIAVKSASEVKNIGSFLMENFLKEAKNAGYQYVVCRIILEPICNHKSIAFHQKFGFKQIGIIEENGLVSGAYFLKI